MTKEAEVQIDQMKPDMYISTQDKEGLEDAKG